ncbi:8-oxo-dGTP diphosphatase [Myroides gitamensis]|uniref:8-oxo-dGTP diphosphatase n=1 Tax=Myroides odoratus TaxID=256 RepID=A0A378U4N1_MYROD|nr:(deoxy)nucleoside triphosphate pyrophosphohydrolase [Myroides odoratus]MCS4237657.1 8-oxo-dGTP diphosphatase [Myroides odoratus]MDH6601602.1 8-oxo-dGTP diphosphatase [Myroides gitamensis]QQU02818.1 (deoxy)nucleoside triphosphate pyrophosphohydrolase [Myroides odoratus]STZ69951.1 8-oxo-dGTP diphosphatase [Myroides odoratus]
MKKVEVVAAILMHNDEILCAQRAENKLEYISKKFEFPGGKIEAGETHQEALKRELQEELDINPEINELYLTVVHQYPDFELTMHSFVCKMPNRKITLKEHISYVWLKKEDFLELDWAAADLPIVYKMMQDE